MDAKVTSEMLKSLFNEQEVSAVVVMDLPIIASRIERMVALFPKTSVHSLAIKACPLVKLLSFYSNQGLGLEAASFPEVQIGLTSGFPSESIVFDSPAKTIGELQQAIRLGLYINIDSFIELERIAEILKENPESQSRFGLRVNPQTGVGSIATTSVAGVYSKFGVPLLEMENEIISAFVRYPWLAGLHVHSGSQACPIELIVQGVRRVLDLAKKCAKAIALSGSPRRITHFDIGGGLSVSYSKDREHDSMNSYVRQLELDCPELFTGEYKLITEFGRYVFANAGIAFSRVEYVKTSAEATTAVIHLGADMFLRECYHPADWKHEFQVFDSQGIEKRHDGQLYQIAGPLCFSGDFIGRDIMLPRLAAGDILAIRDVGAYTFSMWSRYNSRAMPGIYGLNADGSLVTLRKAEKPEDLVAFWS